MGHIGPDLVAFKAGEHVIVCDPLEERVQLLLRLEDPVEPRLADKDQCHGVERVIVIAHEVPELLQGLGREILGLVDDEDQWPPACVIVLDMAFYVRPHGGQLAGRVDAELRADELVKVGRGYLAGLDADAYMAGGLDVRDEAVRGL